MLKNFHPFDGKGKMQKINLLRQATQYLLPLLLAVAGAILSALNIYKGTDVLSILIPMLLVGGGIAISFATLTRDKNNSPIDLRSLISKRFGDLEDKIEQIALEQVAEINELKSSFEFRESDKPVSNSQNSVGSTAETSKEETKRVSIIRAANRIVRAIEALHSYCESLKKTAKFTLLYAMALSFAGIIPLSTAVLSESFGAIDEGARHLSVGEIIAARWPYISLTILVEVVAGIMLKIYYKQIDEIKYNHNEITNLSAQHCAIYTALTFGTKDDITAITKQMSVTERNRILKKNETTEEAQRIKLQSDLDIERLELLSRLLRPSNDIKHEK